MSVEADREFIRRRMATFDAGMDVQVEPLEMYDSARAKIAANLSWLFTKAFGTGDVPAELQDPFYTDQYEQEHIKPPIIHLLLSSELYCIVCGCLLHPEDAAALENHTSVLQALSKRGIYVLDETDTLVSALDLTSAPVQMGSHIHLIDALMAAYTEEMMSVENVISAVKRLSELNDSTKVPSDLEAAMVLWINKVILKLKRFTQAKLKARHTFLETPGLQKINCTDQLSGQTFQHFSFLGNLDNFVSLCTALPAVVHFYCPELMGLEDINLKDTPSIRESLHNVELLRRFSDEFLNKCFHLTPQDMLHSPPLLKSNMMQFISELFWTFEMIKSDFMPPRDISQRKEVKALSRQHRLLNSPKTRLWTLTPKNIMSATSLENSFKARSHSSMLPQRQAEYKEIKDYTLGQRNWSNSITHKQQSTRLPCSRNIQRSPSQTTLNGLNYFMKEDSNSVRLTYSLSEHSLASKSVKITPKHMVASGYPGRLSGRTLLNHIRFEDEEEEIEEEELVSIIDPSTLPSRHHQMEPELKDFNGSSVSGITNPHVPHGSSMDRYCIEPLMPAIRKPAKEKGIIVKKEEECGESDPKGAVRKTRSGSDSPHQGAQEFDTNCLSSASFTSMRAAVQNSSEVSYRDSPKLSRGFYLPLQEGPKSDSPSSFLEASNDSDSDAENVTGDNENELQLMGNEVIFHDGFYRKKQSQEGESAKLGEDLNMNEWDDKECLSACSSPYLSTVSRSSSCTTPIGIDVKMTSFAEKRQLKARREGLSSARATPITTPDSSEAAPCPPWQMKNSNSLDKELCSDSRNNVTMPSEFLELHMELEERRHAIECHKKKMETLSAQQRLKLGKAAFLNVVRKESGRSDTLPLPLKQESPGLRAVGKSKVKNENCKDDSFLDALKKKNIQNDDALLIGDNKLTKGSGQDLNACSRSIEVLNDAIATIQHQIVQLSQQQNILIKQSSELPSTITSETGTTSKTNSSTNSTAAVNFVNIEKSTSVSGHSSPLTAANQKLSFFQAIDNKENREVKSDVEKYETEQDKVENSPFKDCYVTKQQCEGDKTGDSPIVSETPANSRSAAAEEDQNGKPEIKTVDSQTKTADHASKSTRMAAQLIEVDLSEMRKPTKTSSTDAEKEQNVLGFFFKDEDRADEMAKRRAAFLVKQQRKADEAKLRKQQQEVESELKRDEARRKAEEERIRKEEEKARREFIKQEYLRRKQQMLIEEQGLVKSLPRARSWKSKRKPLFREGSSSLVKGTNASEMSNSRRGSALSLATEVESIVSVESQCVSLCSMDLPDMNTERDWEIGSIASSITSTEYTGPRLFKEPSSKSNKPIIINAVAHCCLAGKVNEAQKNVILEELDRCESNHLIILFRDGGCQFRAIYSYSPDTEEITKVTGTGPRNISQKMIDKLYKYSSDRKQFSIIPAKSVSVSIDALTIHNHLWHVRRPGSARRK